MTDSLHLELIDSVNQVYICSGVLYGVILDFDRCSGSTEDEKDSKRVTECH